MLKEYQIVSLMLPESLNIKTKTPYGLYPCTNLQTVNAKNIKKIKVKLLFISDAPRILCQVLDTNYTGYDKGHIIKRDTLLIRLQTITYIKSLPIDTQFIWIEKSIFSLYKKNTDQLTFNFGGIK